MNHIHVCNKNTFTKTIHLLMISNKNKRINGIQWWNIRVIPYDRWVISNESYHVSYNVWVIPYKSRQVSDTVWVIPCESYSVSHIIWFTTSESYRVSHTVCVIPYESYRINESLPPSCISVYAGLVCTVVSIITS